jgi:uncharacterized membrane protein
MDDAGAAGRRRSLAILAFALVAFVALLIFGLGVVSLALDEAVISQPGMTQAPGIVGTILSMLGFAAVAYPALLRRSGVAMAVLTGLASVFGYVAGVAIGGLFSGIDPLRAIGVAGALAISWPAAVVFVASAVCAAAALVVGRARPGTARWPWERDE